MHPDISDILNEWKHEPESSVRRIVGRDGKDKLQVRLPLGIEQYELDGRPDGGRPHGFESLLEYHLHRLAQHRMSAAANEPFVLDSTECGELAAEGILYYYRYILCFQISEYDIVIRDTNRNLRMFDFVRAHAADKSHSSALEQYRPYIIRMNASARAMAGVADGKYDEAMHILAHARKEIGELPDVPGVTFEYEQTRSVAILKQMETDISKQKPLTKREKLERALKRAVQQEDYERAAKLRDTLSKMRR